MSVVTLRDIVHMTKLTWGVCVLVPQKGSVEGFVVREHIETTAFIPPPETFESLEDCEELSVVSAVFSFSFVEHLREEGD